MRFELFRTRAERNQTSAFTLAEVVMAIAITATLFSGIILAYVQATKRAQWSGYSLAAQSLTIQQIEQARSAVWDLRDGRNEIENLVLLSKSWSGTTFRGYMTNDLDLPTTGTNFVRVTNYITVRPLTNNGAPFRMIRVDTVWPFTWGNTTRLYTNTICTYCAPDT